MWPDGGAALCFGTHGSSTSINLAGLWSGTNVIRSDSMSSNRGDSCQEWPQIIPEFETCEHAYANFWAGMRVVS